MKKNLLLSLALVSTLCFAGMARAEAPMSSTSAAPISAQNQKMKDCAASYHQQGIAKSQYRTFMSTCLKKDGSAATAASAATPAAAVPSTASASAAATATNPAVSKASATAPGTTQQSKMKTCNADAKTQGLKGADRKTFMKTCLSGSSATAN
jgi:hypothetical protein